MPLRYGVSFPAWFHPQHPPTPPIPPKVPKQQYFDTKHVLVQRLFVGGRTIPEIMEMLSHYNSDEYFIGNDDGYDANFIELMKLEKYEVIVDEKDFLKQQKDYARSIKDYERLEAEYQARVKKYPSMVYLHEDAKLREILTKAEDELEDAQLRDSESQQILHDINTTIAETKKQLFELQERYKEV